MANPNPNPLANLYAELNKFGQNGDYERALKVANKILSQNSNDGTAFHCKMVCLIQLSRFDEALTAMHKQSQLSSNLQFERAYCEYRLNRTADALKTLRSVVDPDDRMKELLGQVLYRLEEYKECIDTYTDLVKNTQDDYEEERETNLSAVLAALQATSIDKVPDLGLRVDTYELCYNHACYLIGPGNMEEALVELQKAEDLCRESFDDDPESAEDLEAELGVIRVQRGYILQRVGRPEEATKLYNMVLKHKPSDIGLTAVASNNIITLNKEQNMFDSKKKIKMATTDGLQQKLTSQQRRAIAMNQCLLYMHMNQGDQCRHSANTLRQKYSESDQPSLVEAAQYCKDKQIPKAIEVLKKQLEKTPSINLKLTMAQLYLSQGSIYQACDALRSFGDLSYKPGVVSSLVTLYLSQEDREAASEALNNAIKWYRQHEPSSEDLVVLIRANAQFQLKYGSPKVATEMLEDLRKRDPHDLKTLAQLISAYSKFDPKKAEAVSRSLPSPDKLAADVDVDNLESGSFVFGPKYVKKSGKGEHASPKPTSPGASGDTPAAGPAKKKRKRKGKIPKNANPDAAPDPERWLPRRERSYFKGKRRDKRKDIGKGTQGAASGASADLDASKSPTASASGSDIGSPRPGATATPNSGQPTAAAAPSGTGPRQQKPAGKGKKKKKGGKW